jgi:predicted outer membrane repeat protein
MTTKFAENRSKFLGGAIVVTYVVALLCSAAATAYFAPLPRPIIIWCPDCSVTPGKTSTAHLPPRIPATIPLPPKVSSVQTPRLGSGTR